MKSNIRDSFLDHGKEFRMLFSQLAEKKGVHAYLITGEKGMGKRTLAGLMGAALLCSSDTEKPCGRCRDCLLTEKKEHPDLILIEKGKPIAAGIKKERVTIPVEDIREMIRLCGVRSPEGKMHVVIISDADRMTIQAQNCLLKTLEEPPPDTCMILVSEHTESLLSTVISRCRMIRVKSWDERYILSVLEQEGIPGNRAEKAVADSNGSIGRALELAMDENYWQLRDEVIKCFFRTSARSDVLKISNQWKDRKQDSEAIISILEGALRKLSEARFYPEEKIDLSEFPENWKRFSAEAGTEHFVLLNETLVNAKKQVQFFVNFQAVIEKIIFMFMGEGSAWQ